MATVSTAQIPASPQATGVVSEPGLLREIADFFRDFIVAAFDPYRPEMHYMRGPGPACRDKNSTGHEG